MTKIYTKHKKNTPDFIKVRNNSFGKLYANLTASEYLGELNGVIDEEDVVLTSYTLRDSEAKDLGIQSASQIYGSFGDLNHSTKNIFHKRFFCEEESHVAQGFLDEIQHIVLPGFTVFNKQELVEAYKELSKDYTVRLKNPLKSFGEGQIVIKSEQDILNFSKNFSESKFEQGIVVEANMSSKNLETRSAGIITINNDSYIYVGRQNHGSTGTTHTYLGTSIRLSRMQNKTELLKESKEKEIDEKLIKYIELVADNLNKLNITTTRINCDFLIGNIQNYSERSVYLVDPGFYTGGATGAELLALSKLNKSENLSIVEAEYIVKYGNLEVPMGINNIFYTGTDPIYGKILAFGK